MLKDGNGNRIAIVAGGPDDGQEWLVGGDFDGDIFVPTRTSKHRPIYRLEGDRYVFIGYERPAR